MTVCYCFQYALSGKSNCGGCHKTIPTDELRVKRHEPIPQDEGYLCDGYLWSNWFHFECFWNHQGDEDMNDVDPLIQIEKSVNLKENEAIWFENYPYISLNNLNKIPKITVVKIKKNDIRRIQQQLKKAKDHKTDYFISNIMESEIGCFGAYVLNWNCAYSNLSGNLRIQCRGNIYHPQCIKVCRKHILDIKDIKNYNQQTPERKKLIEELFKKSNEFFVPRVETTTKLEYCILSPKDTVSKHFLPISNGSLVIKMKSKTYHPKCFKLYGKNNNMDAKKLLNYSSLMGDQKKILDNIFKASKKRKYESTACGNNESPTKMACCEAQFEKIPRRRT